MTETTLNVMLTDALLQAMEETFEKVNGIYLDRNTSIFETLATIDAAEASRATSSSCATIAAHVAHMTYYNDLLLRVIAGEEDTETDWDHIWQTVSAVGPDEWETIRQDLRASYEQLRTVAEQQVWTDTNEIAGALGLLAHNAYHLGEIRQMLCIIKEGDA